ncbi:M56 family metallopeptidase [Winogradskyella pulchriflava]|uniref:M56 family metallopeptidase n=1 Tax=Winogradskyella pulchriflava TaxID=1110688 RepID=A0ABV6Q4B4_9FLAO
METYILKFTACLAVFWLVYVLVLERLSIHRFKRFYLLASFALSLAIPALTITKYIEPVVYGFEVLPSYTPMEAELIELPAETTPWLTTETVLWFVYIIGVLLFSIRFAVNLYRLSRRISKNPKYKKQNFIYVLLTECRIPHSFFKYIFVNQQRFEEQRIPQEVILHEETHAKQLHSLDILLVEFLQIVFWFHPLVYILKHHIKLNHEFLADEAVIQKGSDTKAYQNILLQFSSSTHDFQLTSAINYSSIKKRFTVMKTQTSKTRIWLSSLLLLPIIAILFYSFAEREYVEKENSEIVNAIKNELNEANNLNLIYVDEATESSEFLVTVEKNGNTLELKCESGCRWSHLILEPSSETYIINDFGFSKGKTLESDKFAFSIRPNENGVNLNGLKGTAWVNLAFSLPKNKNQAINQLGMTNETVPNLEQISVDLQKRAEENYYKNQSFVVKDEQGRNVKKKFFELDYDNKIKWVYTNEIPYHRIDVTELHFEEAKNSKNYIIKVNGNYTSDEELNKYKASDFITFSYTPISELAKMKEQSVLNLVTPEAYNLFVRLMIDNYRQTLEDYENEIKSSDIKRKIDIKELVRTYEFLYYNFKKFTPEIIKQNQLIPPTPISAKENEWQKIEDILDGQKPTAKEIAEYNTWAKKIHTESKALSGDTTFYPPIDEEDLIKYSEIYKRMSSQQKNKAVEFPFPELDVIASQQKATKKQIAEYNAWAKKMNAAIKKAEATNNKSSYPIIKKNEYDKFYKIYRTLMSEKQRENAEPWPNIPPPPPPPPPAPETPKVKKGSEVIPPPPPPPPPAPESTLDFVIRMAKANAKFFNEGKVISSDEAIALIKKNDKLNINAQKTDTEQPLVYITKEPIQIGSNDKVGEAISKPQQSILPKVNGKTIKIGKLKMTISEFKKLELSTEVAKVTGFKIKIPGVATEFVQGNTITKTTISNLDKINHSKMIAVFDIKDEKESNIAPLIIELIE